MNWLRRMRKECIFSINARQSGGRSPKANGPRFEFPRRDRKYILQEETRGAIISPRIAAGGRRFSGAEVRLN